MFGLFKALKFQDERLGEFRKSGHHWKGTIPLGKHGSVELRLAGGRESPDSASLSVAHELPVRYDALRSQIEKSLFEHYQPYREADSADGLAESSEPLLRIDRADAVWAHVAPEYVLIEQLSGSPKAGPTVEIAYRVTWDEEHTVGARIQGWQLFELCGSV